MNIVDLILEVKHKMTKFRSKRALGKGCTLKSPVIPRKIIWDKKPSYLGNEDELVEDIEKISNELNLDFSYIFKIFQYGAYISEDMLTAINNSVDESFFEKLLDQKNYIIENHKKKGSKCKEIYDSVDDLIFDILTKPKIEEEEKSMERRRVDLLPDGYVKLSDFGKMVTSGAINRFKKGEMDVIEVTAKGTKCGFFLAAPKTQIERMSFSSKAGVKHKRKKMKTPGKFKILNGSHSPIIVPSVSMFGNGYLDKYINLKDLVDSLVGRVKKEIKDGSIAAIIVSKNGGKKVDDIFAAKTHIEKLQKFIADEEVANSKRQEKIAATSPPSSVPANPHPIAKEILDLLIKVDEKIQKTKNMQKGQFGDLDDLNKKFTHTFSQLDLISKNLADATKLLTSIALSIAKIEQKQVDPAWAKEADNHIVSLIDKIEKINHPKLKQSEIQFKPGSIQAPHS